MVNLTNFAKYVAENAASNQDICGMGSNRLDVLISSYIDMGGQLPLCDKSCRDVINSGMDAYFKIKKERIDAHMKKFVPGYVGRRK